MANFSKFVTITLCVFFYSSFTWALDFGMPPTIPAFVPDPALPEGLKRSDLSRFPILQPEAAWDEIKGWKLEGTRWAAALNQKGKVIALYDLAYPRLMRPARLGKVGGAGFNLETIKELIEKYSSSGRSREATRAMREFSRATKAQLQNNLLPAKWWKSIPWKPKAWTERLEVEIQNNGEPLRFSFSDIQFRKVSNDYRQFQEVVAYFSRFSINLDGFTFVRVGQNEYELYWQATPFEANLSEQNKPKKVADLQSIHAGLCENITFAIAQAAVGIAAGLLPDPVLAALLGTALNRVLIYQNELLNLHRSMLNEALTLTEENNPLSPFRDLAPSERALLGQSLFVSQPNFVTFWKWLFRGTNRAWRESMSDNLKAADNSSKWLTNEHDKLFLITPRFAFATNGARKHLHSLSAYRYTPKSRPAISIDYEKPDSILQQRLAAESASVLVDFATRFIPIPVVGGIVATVFNAIVRDPITSCRTWESGLINHLEERVGQNHEDWSRELSILDLQQLNPLEESRTDLPEIIALRKKSIGY